MFDTSDMVIVALLAVGAAVYFLRKPGGGSSPTAPPKSFGGNSSAKLTSSSSVKLGSSSSNLGGLNARMEKQGKNAVIFYGSQTGTAEDYANRLAREGKQYGFECFIADPETYEMSELADITADKLVILVLATYGEGEPTDNAQEAYRYFNDGEADSGSLKNLRYTVFGLGNKTYEHYNEIGKFFDRKLEDYGGVRVFEIGLGDDDGSLEEDYINWRDRMWPAVCERFGKTVDPNSATVRQFNLTEHPENAIAPDRVFKGQISKLPKANALQTSPPYDVKNPYLAEVVVNRELMKGGDRHCMHIEVKIKDTPLSYQTGDHLGIFPSNDPAEVKRLAERLQIADVNKLFTMTAVDSSAPKKNPFPAPCSYQTALTHYIDIQAIARTHILKALLEYVTDPQEKERLTHLLNPAQKEEANKFLQGDGRNIIDVLNAFPSAHPPADLIFELLPRLQCRYYSISSSPAVQPDVITICATVADYVTPTGRHGSGVCTSWLFSMQNPELQTFRIPVFVRRSNFKLPKDVTKPIIMIGPGTGVAPFRGFVQDRSKQRASGKTVGSNVLFFGCRKSNEDFLYDDEFLKCQTDGDLELFTAFSRETEKKVYVQHRLAEQSKLIWSHLEKGGYLYVCGDAKNMARDVNKTLVDISKEIGGKTEDQAILFVKNLRSTGRYLEDVWS